MAYGSNMFTFLIPLFVTNFMPFKHKNILVRCLKTISNLYSYCQDKDSQKKENIRTVGKAHVFY